ncbi:MAG TPA: PIN domain-containing protein [Methylomirabilota bacterium]|nr:PIN domain-containing protein [Methylomirabilota bacterium]
MAAAPGRRPRLSPVRLVFVTLVGYGGYLLADSLDLPLPGPLWTVGGVLVGVLAGFAVLALEQAARQVPLPRLFVGAIGAVGGVLMAQIVAGALLVIIPGMGTPAGRGFLSLVLAYIGIVFALRREEELGGLTRKLFPSTAAPRDQSFKVLDTSVIIDGRIADVCQAGFLEGTLLIPQYILRELHQIADSSDALKRNRGRRGLDILQRLQRMPKVRVELHDLDFPQIREVDRRLIETARAVGGTIVTNDYNLNKVAELHGVRVLNVNELANALRPVVLPGELLHVSVLREGKEAGQGVAYLDDGTMVVIEQGKKYLGQSVNVTVTSVLQTSAGRMIFSRPADEDSGGRR